MATTLVAQPSQNLETFILLWLDSLVNKSEDNIDTKKVLRQALTYVIPFDDSEKCLEFIQSHAQERIVLIVSGRLGQILVPHIHEFPQLISIYVYCSDKERNEKWAKDFIKVKGVIVDLNNLIIRIKADQTKRNDYKIDESLPIRVFYKSSEEKQSVVINNNNFIYLQLIIDCLSQMKSKLNTKPKLISLCKEEYKDNKKELNDIYEFEGNYTSDRAIWWLTRESFVNNMLNKAFQSINIDLLYYFHFFITDIQQQLIENKYSSSLRTFRPQLMSNQEIKLLKYSMGELISINTFFFTTPNRLHAIEMFQSSDIKPDFKRVLFQIDADSQLEDMKPFSDITSLNYFTGTDIILFMAGTIFRPVDICQENDMMIIQMETYNDKDRTIKTRIDIAKGEEYGDTPDLFSFGYVLSKMKKFDEAEKYYNRLLEEMPNDQHSKICCYQGFGAMAMEKKDYDSSIQYYQQALNMKKSILRSEDPEIASAYGTIADIYVKKGAFTEAFQIYNEALKIWTRALGKDHPKVATCYKSIACIFEMQNKYNEAIDYYEKVLIIYEQNSSIHEADVAQLHNHIALIYNSIGDLNQVLKHYKLAWKIFSKVYSNNHPDAITALKNIGLTYEAAGNLNQALAHYEKIASIHRQLLPSNHPEINEIQRDINRVYSQLK
ncbi:unnamed protein product [Rotaria sp. Silwood2]|nr:unnamed protein product [Rotaria sp. Silwood2]CAF2882459.1 unnamed protein product [Rotaria sp. Silwood2]CAF4234126.1 unnamed protein product [Rotaria sp. Silwood2]CAF4373075.1 unnamed protein product [Rotaria sp. Silwood2]